MAAFTSPAPLDATKLKITTSQSLKDIPQPEALVFGEIMTDHMLVVSYDPINGWSAPEIKPYAPLSIDPASSCLQYCPNVFEGMKAYAGPDGKARLFRPQENMKRLSRSVDRMALPSFDEDALITLIRKLVLVDERWIPKQAGHSLYIRPTMIGTRAALGVTASDSALLFVILSPTGPYFRTGADPKPIALLAVGEIARSWPGGTGGHKLGLNYAPGFQPQRVAKQKGYDQVLWLLGPEQKITEAGAMNFFITVARGGDSDIVDVITPPLDGTILPGITRASCIALLEAHGTQGDVLPGVPKVAVYEKALTIGDLVAFSASGRLLESFGVGTAVIVAPVGKIGYTSAHVEPSQDVVDIYLPSHAGLGPIGQALHDKIVNIQEGRDNWGEWSVPCD